MLALGIANFLASGRAHPQQLFRSRAGSADEFAGRSRGF